MPRLKLNNSEDGYYNNVYLYNGLTNVWEEVRTLVAAAAAAGGGGGGTVTSANLPLSITNGIMSIDLSGYMATTHEANEIGTADVDFGAFGATSEK